MKGECVRRVKRAWRCLQGLEFREREGPEILVMKRIIISFFLLKMYSQPSFPSDLLILVVHRGIQAWVARVDISLWRGLLQELWIIFIPNSKLVVQCSLQ